VMCILPVPVESRYFQIASSVLARWAFKGSLRVEMNANQLIVPWCA
jgi:hypothetical protein